MANILKNIKNRTAKIIKEKSEEGTFQQIAGNTEQFVKDKASGIKRDLAPISDENWNIRAAQACEAVSDALLREESGVSKRIVKGVSGKLGFAGTGAGIFSVASLLGTASTGTAIGSLSGAAFTNAALAFVGGSMFVGSIIIGVASIAGGLGAVIGAGWAYRKFAGEKREKSELDEQEQRILDVCLSLAVAFREQNNSGAGLDTISAKAVYGEALKPLCEELLECKYRASSWPILARRNLYKAIDNIQNITGYLYNWSKKHPNVTVGIVSVVILQLLSDDIPNFNEQEEFVLEALRRSNHDLTNATEIELASYIQDMNPAQLSGLSNNVKGIYHELLYQNKENTDGDQYIVEIFDATNHAGSDIRIINTVTDDVKEVQLKATKYISYIKEHNEKYENIEVFATEEVANLDPSIMSTGFSNTELNEEVLSVVSGLNDYDDPSALSSMSIAGMVTLARNAKVILKGGSVTQAEKEKLVKDGAISAGVAGFVHLII